MPRVHRAAGRLCQGPFARCHFKSVPERPLTERRGPVRRTIKSTRLRTRHFVESAAGSSPSETAIWRLLPTSRPASGKAEAGPRPGQLRGAACSWSAWAPSALLASGGPRCARPWASTRSRRRCRRGFSERSCPRVVRARRCRCARARWLAASPGQPRRAAADPVLRENRSVRASPAIGSLVRSEIHSRIPSAEGVPREYNAFFARCGLPRED